MQTKFWQKKLAGGFLLVLAFVCARPAETVAQDSAPPYVAVATGPVNGIYYPLGRAICERFMKPRGKLPGAAPHCAAMPTLGSAANLQALRGGETAFAIIQGDFDRIAEGTAVVAGLHWEMLTVLAHQRSDARRLRLLAPQRVETGPEGSGHHFTATEVALALGWKAPTVRSWNGRDIASRRFCDGALEAVILMTGHPAGHIQELLLTCPARLLPLDRLTVTRIRQRDPNYEPAVISAGTYERQRRNIPTLGRQALLVARSDLPVAAVERMATALVQDLEQLRRSHPALSRLTRLKLAQPRTALPLHPAAAAVFEKERLRSVANPPPEKTQP